jgi:hypothetical protein
MNRPTYYPRWPFLLVGFLGICMPSASMFEHFAGVGGATVYVIAIAGIVAALPFAVPIVLTRLSLRTAGVLGALALLIIIAGFAIIYPRVNTHQPGRGSDRDEALNVGVSEMLHGRYPYHARTYLDAAISPGPGALVQSIPFWLIGNSAYQNFFWIPVATLVAGMLMNDLRLSVVMMALTLILCPTMVLLEIFSGGDYFANSLYIMTAACLCLMSRSSMQLILSGALLGILLSSRANYVFIVPIIMAFLARDRGWRAALTCLIALLAALLALTLPFYLHDPASFGPLAAQNKFAGFDSLLPHTEWIVGSTLVLLTLALTGEMLRKRHHWSTAMAGCAAVLIYPALFGAVLDSIARHRLSYAFGGWSASATIFASLALFARISSTPLRSSAPIDGTGGASYAALSTGQ